MRLLLAVLSLAVTPCTPGPNAQPEDSSDEKAPSGEADAPSALEAARSSVTVHMPEHLTRATSIRDAVILGRLPDAKPPAKYLSEHWPEQVLETWIPYVNGLRHAAGEVHRAADMEAAGRATAALAQACGQCHQAMDQGPAFEPGPPQPQGPDALMARHRWAADRLWEGVVQPSEQRWFQGVEGLQEIPTCRDDPGGEQLTETIEAARETTERVRLKAKEAGSLEARARLYGELLPTCSACHLAGC